MHLWYICIIKSVCGLLKVLVVCLLTFNSACIQKFVFGTEKVERLLFRQFFSLYLFHSKVFIVKFHVQWFSIIQSNFFQQFKGWLSNNSSDGEWAPRDGRSHPLPSTK